MFTRQDIIDKIISLMKELMDAVPEKPDLDALLFEDYGADSIVIVQLYLSCQEYFGIALADAVNLAEPVSINGMADTVADKLLEAGRLAQRGVNVHVE